MSLGPRNRPGKHTSIKQFTDREYFIEAFDNSLKRLDPQDNTSIQLLVFHGVSGIGKTALREFLGRKIDQEKIAKWALVNFDIPTNRQAENALFVMRDELKRKYKFRFPTFDLAYSVYWERVHPQIALSKADVPWLDEGDILMDIMLAVEAVPGLGLLTKVPKAISEIGGKARDWWKKQEDEFRLLNDMEPHKILDRLSMYWALDLKQAISVTGERVVLFLDTYEALWDGKRDEHYRFTIDSWVREWVLQLPQVLWVISGRDRLDWAELNVEWDNVLTQEQLVQLAEHDARHFLTTALVSNVDVQDVIIQGAQGVPFYLDIAVDMHTEILNAGGLPTAENFANAPREVLDHFLKYVDRSERETLRVLSVARTWDRTLFGRVVSDFSTGYPAGALDDLCRFSFIEEVQIKSVTGEQMWTIHALMRESFEMRSDPNFITRSHKFLFEFYNDVLLEVTSKDLTERHKYAFVEAFYHCRKGFSIERFVEWYTSKKPVFEQAAQWRVLIPLQEEVTLLLEIQLGANHPSVALALNSLAELYRAQGRYNEAEPLYMRSLAVLELQLEANHPDRAALLNNLAELYRAQGRYNEAEPLYARSISILEQQLGADHPDVAALLNNLAALYRAQGRHNEAKPLYAHSISILEQHLGADHPDVAAALNNLAALHMAQHLYEEAEPAYTRSLSIREQQLGADHPDVAASLNNLADLYRFQERYTEAEPLYVRSLSIREHQLGEDHPDLAASLGNLASLYCAQGRYKEAERLYARSHIIFEQQFGSSHPHVAASLNNLAEFYRAQGRYKEAEPLYVRSLSILDQLLGENHPDVATALYNLAELYRTQERYEEAEQLYVRSLSIWENSLGSNHPHVAATLNKLAEIYFVLGRYEEAERFYMHNLSILERLFGEDHPHVLESLNKLGELYGTQGLYKKSEPIYARILSSLEKQLGADHEFTSVIREIKTELQRKRLDKE